MADERTCVKLRKRSVGVLCHKIFFWFAFKMNAHFFF